MCRVSPYARRNHPLAQDELLRNENFISLDLNQVGSTQPEVDVAVNVCELDGKPPLSQTARR